ncbi:hypothetical protein N1031_04610 [Herbiconiux moechotypicola]|uniref:Uncharacterized protein n=1 Tax=Herbiconiux moechotypicola TaxID=637393 RepID=A0ABN3DAC3_9MICO|nr:hypothetical protein [Herbiconiux moechotypicola]MCS5729033.1 hypothetical protein [Herbiconiux moechotypicola]
MLALLALGATALIVSTVAATFGSVAFVIVMLVLAPFRVDLTTSVYLASTLWATIASGAGVALVGWAFVEVRVGRPQSPPQSLRI